MKRYVDIASYTGGLEFYEEKENFSTFPMISAVQFGDKNSGEVVFCFHVCTPKRLTQLIKEFGYFSDNLIVVEKYDEDEIKRIVELEFNEIVKEASSFEEAISYLKERAHHYD